MPDIKLDKYYNYIMTAVLVNAKFSLMCMRIVHLDDLSINSCEGGVTVLGRMFDAGPSCFEAVSTSKLNPKRVRAKLYLF